MNYCLDTDGDGLGNPGTEIQECIDPEYFSFGTCSDSNCEVVDKSGNVKGYISNQELQSSLTRS